LTSDCHRAAGKSTPHRLPIPPNQLKFHLKGKELYLTTKEFMVIITTPVGNRINPLSAKWKWLLYASARLAFRLRSHLSLFNFIHLWFRFQTV